jgi:HK97 family phage major capsid protein
MALAEILTTKLQEAEAEWDGLIAKAETEGRGHTEEETARIEVLKKEWSDAQTGLANLDARENFKKFDSSSRGKPVSAGASMPRGTTKAEGDGTSTLAKPSLSQSPAMSMGEFAQAVQQFAVSGERDPRLKIAAATASTYANETTGADGAVLVPPDYSTDVGKLLDAGDYLLPFCDNQPIGGNAQTFPKDETTPWGSTGVRAYWTAEAAAGTQNKPVLKTRTMRLRKLMVLIPVTEELLADAIALGPYLMNLAARAIRWKVNDAIVNGNGAGMPLGIKNAPCLVSQAAEGSQTADTINGTNISKMFGRLLPDSVAPSRWLISNDSFHQLPIMTVSSTPIWTPPNAGFKDAPGGVLFGKPIHISPTCQTIGDVGDIYLADLSQYRVITKAGGVQAAQSNHLWFDQDLMAFKWTFRMDGQPTFESAVSVAYGTTTLSPFVALAAR